MPELPEVETVVRQLRPLIEAAVVRTVEVYDPLLRFGDGRRLAGRRIAGVERLGKQIVLRLEADRAKTGVLWLAIHLRMTGRLEITPDAPRLATARAAAGIRQQMAAPVRVRFVLVDGRALVFRDVRRFGTVRLYERREQALPEGLDPTTEEFTEARLRELIAGSRTAIKIWLLRQDRIVGIGNIYASEALFRAGINPERAAGALTRAELGRLTGAIRTVLELAIEAGGTTFSTFQNVYGGVGGYQHNLAVYDHEGDPCPRCARPIARFVQAQRSTFFCPKCQCKKSGPS